jgi:oligoribonuclease
MRHNESSRSRIRVLLDTDAVVLRPTEPVEIDRRAARVKKTDNLIWIDLEMTGLDTQADRIIEIATVVTDPALNVLAEGPVLAIHQHETVLDAMDEWNRTTHSASGLIQRVRESRLTAAEAEAETLRFLAEYSQAGASPMCGNSICQDRRFLAREMPSLEKFFHYRNLDVSTVKELARRWAPAVLEGVAKTSTHLALDDIRESIRELDHYRRQFFRLA